MSYAMRVSSLDHVPTFGATKVSGKREDTCCRGFPCCLVSHKSLYLVAMFIWVVGVVVCTVKGVDYYRSAESKGAGQAGLLGAHRQSSAPCRQPECPLMQSVAPR